MKSPLVALCVLSVLCAALPQSSSAQNDNPDGAYPGVNGFWEVITSTGKFVARLDQIASVSTHEYVIDGGIRVTECTIDTDGGQTARFYYIESVLESSDTVIPGASTVNRLKDIANQVSQKAGTGNIDTIVTKHYPDTTHAKTSEYRVENKETIGQIYDHVHKVWAQERGKGGQNQLIIRNG